MDLVHLALSVVVAVTVSSCGNSSVPEFGVGEEIPIGLSDSALRIVIPSHSVAPGDSFECYFTNISPERDIFVNGSTGRQGPGGHHLTVYYANTPQQPGHHPCVDAEMVDWRQVGASSGDPKGDGVVDLPPGVAVKVPAGKQIVVQTHYINATATAMQAEDEITVHLLHKEQVTTFVQGFAVFDGAFEIPARARYTHAGVCTLTRDFDLILLLGHMHERVEHYKLEHLDASGKLLDTVLDQNWEPAFASHPPTARWSVEKPYKLRKGEKLRQTCSWKNNDGGTVGFPREMCVGFSMYLGDDGFLDCTAE